MTRLAAARPLRLGRCRRALVVAPHADDEAIGACGLIRRLRAAGVDVRILVVSDGAGSHRRSRLWPTHRLVAERRRETRRAMRRLGIAAARIRHLGLPDGALPGLSRRRVATIGRAARRVNGLDLIVAPAADDAHPDHRAVAAAIAASPLRGARRLSYRIWPDRALAGGRARHATILGAAGMAAKRSLIRGYRTQTGAIADDPDGFAIDRATLVRFAAPLERYREERRCGP